MDDQVMGISLTIVFFCCTALLFVGAMTARKGTHFWATRTLVAGSTLLLIGSAILVIFGLLMTFQNLGRPFLLAMGIIGYLFALLGFLVYLIGFFGFCARWSATGKRNAELMEITAALSAAKQSQTQTPHPTPSS